MKMTLPSEFVELNSQELETIVGGGWCQEVSGFANALCSGVMGALDGLKKVKDIDSTSSCVKLLAALSGIVTGFAKGFADGRKCGSEIETSVKEIKTLTAESR